MTHAVNEHPTLQDIERLGQSIQSYGYDLQRNGYVLDEKGEEEICQIRLTLENLETRLSDVCNNAF